MINIFKLEEQKNLEMRIKKIKKAIINKLWLGLWNLPLQVAKLATSNQVNLEKNHKHRLKGWDRTKNGEDQMPKSSFWCPDL